MPGSRASSTKGIEELPLVKSLRLIDPLLQFLTRKTGKASVPLTLLKMVLPGGFQLERHQCLLQHIPELSERGVLQISSASSAPLSWEDATVEVSFPSPPDQDDTDYSQCQQTLKQTGSLSSSTKAAAKRRLAALKRALKTEMKLSSKQNNDKLASCSCGDQTGEQIDARAPPKSYSSEPQNDWDSEPGETAIVDLEEELCSEGKAAFEALHKLFKFKKPVLSESKEKLSKNSIPEYILPKQAAYSGSSPVQMTKFGELAHDVQKSIPDTLLEACGLASPGRLSRRKLYSHQATAINSAIRRCHTMVCTSTGSGKSLCFLLPALAAAYNSSKEASMDKEPSSGKSLIMFPTKALAQDQLSKLKRMLSQNEELQRHIVPATLDGDCSHEQRAHAAKRANILLTNPDTLHAAILPNWEKLYSRILTQLDYVIIDEAHVYEGVFGAHVALVLSRLYRLCVAANIDRRGGKATPTFLAASATLSYPEHHMRLLCPISKDEKLVVLTAAEDGSPRSAKHFFVWNPPLLEGDGASTGSVEVLKAESTASGKSKAPQASQNKNRRKKVGISHTQFTAKPPTNISDDENISDFHTQLQAPSSMNSLHRRHAADETALLLARAIVNNVRCIAFCKTRMVVEWVYERTIAALKSQKTTEHLAAKVQPYRGGYKLSDRREIEAKLFKKELLGVVATSALELGVDIGGIDLTLHTGYPASISSLYQQAGRAGRQKRLDSPSLSIVICFASPAEQHLWKQPRCLLSRGVTSPMSFPVNCGVIQGHLLCASKEFPLTGQLPVSVLRDSADANGYVHDTLPDQDLFGSRDNFTDAVNALYSNSSLVRFSVPVASGDEVMAFKAHPSIDKPWTHVSVRSIEPIGFSIVDLSHPDQGGKMDGVHDEKAVLDHLPYSRVFYHAFPGAIILHRGKKYKVISMTRPPPFDPSCIYKRNMNLAAFAKPTKEKYFTRPLSTNTITIVKQLERVDIDCHKLPAPTTDGKAIDNGDKRKGEELPASISHNSAELSDETSGSLAGCGIVTSKRTVHGYKKLSLITRAEISRHDLSLPGLEYDTFGLWIDTEAEIVGPFLGKDFGSGVHALSHALLAVAPLFIPCVRGDLECDHSTFNPTRVCLFDERAGGSGTCAELWKSLFISNGLLEAAIKLLEDCPSCSQSNADDYDGGCPACLQSGQCVKFNQFLSRSAALVIGKRMLRRLQQSSLYQTNASSRSLSETSTRRTLENPQDSTPRKKARCQGLRDAMDLKSARERLFVVGRPTWPTDAENMPGGRQENAD